MKIGLLFGSFDPFHIGHLSVVTSALNSGQVEKVWIIPAFKSPWKNHYADFYSRYRMILSACIGLYDKVSIYPVESDLIKILGRPPYTIEVIDFIKETYEDSEFYIITSTETIVEIEKWHEGKRILEENKFIVVGREGFPISPDIKKVKPLEWIDAFGFEGISISSTKIRKWISNKYIPIPYINADQYDLIKQNHLYEKL